MSNGWNSEPSDLPEPDVSEETNQVRERVWSLKATNL